jgi:hypothetical protein
MAYRRAMAITFKHKIEGVDGLVVRFTSQKVHPDAGIAWAWHHAVLAIARIAPLDQNPITLHFGDDLFDDTKIEAGYREIYADVVQMPKGKKGYETTVRFTDSKWIPSALVKGFTWESSA